jgi:hypothetical protein
MNSVLCRMAVLAGLACSGIAAGQVSEAWAVRYNGPGNGNDRAAAITGDAAGSVYIAGVSRGSGGFGEFTTIKYGPTGVEEWTRHYAGYGLGSDAWALAHDGNGHVYVTGRTQVTSTNSVYTTIKYSADGQEIWVREYNGPGNGNDAAAAIIVDAQGGVYVTGSSDRNGTTPGLTYGLDYATIKYDQNGQELWVQRYNGGTANLPTAMAVDSLGNVFVTGRTGIPLVCATVKYDSNGNQLWVRQYTVPGGGSSLGTAIAVDSHGSAFVACDSDGGATRADYATIKYNAAGDEMWVRRYDGPGNHVDRPTGIAVDHAGNVYTTGVSRAGSTAASSDYATIKYDTSGNQLWLRRYNGTGNGQDSPNAISVDAAGTVYVTGPSVSAGGYTAIATVAYDTHGVGLWIAEYTFNGTHDDARAMHLDAQQNIIVAGVSGPYMEQDMLTVKYLQDAPCYANCDQSSVPPVLNVDDFTCFINRFAGATTLPQQEQVGHWANCDQSTVAPVLNVDDFTCFINRFAAGCR